MKDGKQTDAKRKSPKNANLNDVSKGTKDGKENTPRARAPKMARKKTLRERAPKMTKKRCQGQEH